METDLKSLIRLIDKVKSEVIHEEELGYKQISLLLLLQQKDMNVSEISKEMNSLPSAISGLTNKLFKKGLIQRKYSEHDRRSVNISLSELGNDKATHFKMKHDEVSRNVLSSLTEQEIRVFNEILNKLNTF